MKKVGEQNDAFTVHRKPGSSRFSQPFLIMLIIAMARKFLLIGIHFPLEWLLTKYPKPFRSMSARLFVGNLPYNATENDLQDHFGQAGVVVSVNILQDRTTGRSRGFGFVEMSSQEEASKAISLFNKKEFQGRPLTVDSAKPKETRPPRAGA